MIALVSFKGKVSDFRSYLEYSKNWLVGQELLTWYKTKMKNA